MALVALVTGAAACTGGDGDGGGGLDDPDDGLGLGEVLEEDPADDGVLPTYPTQHPRIYLTPHRERLQAALAAGTPAATRFRAITDAWVGGESVYSFGAWNAALLGALTGEPAYCKKAVAEVEAQVAAAEARIAAGDKPEVSRDSYLHVGEMIGDLALVYDWCFDAVAPAQRARWISYANQAVWNVWHHGEAKWGGRPFPWTGWSTANPANNYYYSFLRATMLLGLATKGENAQADGWIAQFRDTKVFGELIPLFTEQLAGGGSREGTGYGVSLRRLFELYNLWKATTGENLATKSGHARASLRAFIHQTMPTLDRVAPIGDHARDASGAWFDYHRDYVLQLVALFPNDALARRAKGMLAASSVPAMTQSFMRVYDFLLDNPDVAPLALDGINTAYYAPGIGELYARSGWDRDATWIGLIAGAYTESHAHQDQGSILIYKGGWLAHDGNIHSRSGLSQVTTSHGLVRIDSGGAPVKQIASTTSKLVALEQGDDFVYAAADLTAAYKGNPAVGLVQRELVYLQPNVVIVFDRVRSAAGTTQTWQLPAPVRPALAGDSATIASAGHELRVVRVAPSPGALAVTDMRADADLTGGWRLDQRAAGGDQRYLHVLGVDGAVVSAAATGSAARPGVTVTLAGGAQVTVAFARDEVGATLERGGVTSTLGGAVAAPRP